MLNGFDYAVIGLYFVFLLAVGTLFRKSGKDSSDYFRGGGSMAWWLVGSSAFMASFSAWTFTGAAGLAYECGLVVWVIYIGNVCGFAINAIWLAPVLRQTRVVAVMEAVRGRLGSVNEQFFTWTTLPLQVIGSAITLYGLAIFCAPAFGFDLCVTILLCGGAVVFVSTVGGSWAIAAGDFLQALMLTAITIVMAVKSLVLVGGPGMLLKNLPPAHLDITASHAAGFGILWVVATGLEKLLSLNTLTGATRYLCARTGREASRAALLSCALFLFGCVVWFIPPLAARTLHLDLASAFPSLSRPEEGAYVAMAQLCLPTGLLGLMITGIISATLSATDHGLNRNSGIFVRSFYLPVLRPCAGEKELVWAGRLSTVVFGVLVILLSLLFSSWKHFGVLKLMLNFTAMLGLPMSVPMFWCLILRKGPDWVAWSTVLVCLALSLVWGVAPSLVLSANTHASWTTIVETIRTHDYICAIFGNLIVGSAWYLVMARLFDRRLPLARRSMVADFFATIHRPLSREESGTPAVTARQSITIGKMALFYSGFIALLLFIPNDLPGRLSILFCSLFIGSISSILILIGSRQQRAASGSPARNTGNP
ncbi:MAG: hypothetical protein WC003_01680 [Terrimicrobiaceae bacterium]